MRFPGSGLYVRYTLGALLALGTAQACGPDFQPDIFVRTDAPDVPAHFLAGRLGLLQPGFARADLLVAYRYLAGGSLSPAEQTGWQPEWQQITIADAQAPDNNAVPVNLPETPAGQWVLARNNYPDAPPGPISQFRSVRVAIGTQYSYEAAYFNCGDDAFRTATVTLKARAALWHDGPYLPDWLHAQDAVFTNCHGGATLPAPAPTGSPALLVKDRAYQTAAAQFYAQQFVPARTGFAAISQDAASPWQPLAGYLVARVLVRQASFAKPGANPEAQSDPALMQEAATALRTYLAGNPPTNLRVSAEAELALVRLRAEPDQRARELAALVSGSGGPHDPNYAQDLEDLLWLINKRTPEGLRAQPEPYEQVPDADRPGSQRQATEAEAIRDAMAQRQSAYAATAATRALAPIVDWTITLESQSPAAAVHAHSEWKSTHALPWLVAALTLAPDTAPATDLAEAAAAVPENSPGWQTVTYHRVRLLLGSSRDAEARGVLAEALPRIGQEDASGRNAFRGLALRAAPSLAGFLAYAPRAIVVVESEEHYAIDACSEVMKNPKRHYNCLAEVSPTQIDADAAGVLNTQAPLSVWRAAAQSSALSPQLRQAVAQGGWARAVLLEDQAAASEFVPLLPADLQAQADRQGLGQWMALARNPGLVPFVNAGTQRAYSWDFVESYRDNWCYKQPSSGSGPQAAFLTPSEKAQGAQQARGLALMRADAVGQKLLDAVRAHPEEPRNAEALYLILRMVRYGCVSPEAPPPAPGAATGNPQNYTVATNPSEEAKHLYRLRQEAARILRQRYAASPWTKRAAPFAG